MKFIGIDLGGTNIKAALVNENGEILKKANALTRVSDGRDLVSKRIALMVKELAIGESKIKIGIGSPGSIDRKNGTVKFSPNLPDWNDFAIVERIENETGFQAFLENDAKAAALGEKWFGAAKNVESFVVITLGTGVGGGAVTNGHLMTGGGGIGGELGHIIIDPNGPLCGCGSHGCLETFCSISGMKRMIFEHKKKYPKSLIFDLTSDGDYGGKEIFQAFGLKDRLAEIVVRKFCWALGIGIGSLVNIFNPELVIISGGISQAFDSFIEEVRKTAFDFTLFSMQDSYEIVPSFLRENAAILGAASVALEMGNKD